MDTALFRKQRRRLVDGRAPSRTCCPTPTLDGQRTHMNPTALGSGSRMLNAYSLVNSQAVYEGQRAAAPDQRVFILTRSAFAGQQRYARGRLVGRHHLDLDGDARSRSRPGSGFVDLGHAVLDAWTSAASPCPPRFSRRAAHGRGRRGMARAERPLVRVRHLRARCCACTARRPSARCGSSAARRTPPTRPS